MLIDEDERRACVTRTCMYSFYKRQLKILDFLVIYEHLQNLQSMLCYYAVKT